MAMPMRANKAANEVINSAERRWLAEMASHIKALIGPYSEVGIQDSEYKPYSATC